MSKTNNAETKANEVVEEAKVNEASTDENATAETKPGVISKVKGFIGKHKSFVGGAAVGVGSFVGLCILKGLASPVDVDEDAIDVDYAEIESTDEN